MPNFMSAYSGFVPTLASAPALVCVRLRSVAHQGALPLGTPPRAVALGTIHFGGGMGGADRDVARSVSAPPIPPPMDRFQRASPFDGGPGGRASWWVPGRSPARTRVARSMVQCHTPRGARLEGTSVGQA